MSTLIKKLSFRRVTSSLLAISLVVGMGGFSFVDIAQAASLTTVSDTVTNHNASATTSNTIAFTTVSSVPIGTVGLTGGQIKFDFSIGTVSPTIGTITTGDVSLTVDGTPQTFNTISAGSAVSGAGLWGITSTSTSITLSLPTATTVGASKAVVFKIGTAAGGTNRITNGSAGTEILTITTKSDATTTIDTGLVAMPIISNDQVVVKATVNPAITFTISSNTVDFGPLTSNTVRYASSSTAGTTSLTTPAHTLAVVTNAGSGYTLTYTAPTTLTDGSHPITATTIDCGTAGDTSACTDDPNGGTYGTSQFAMSAIGTAGSPTVTTSYLYTGLPSGVSHTHWNFATGTTTTLATGSTTSGDTIGVRYLANIPGTQAPGSYTLTMTYIATGNF